MASNYKLRASTSASSSAAQYKYDVFLSFRGEDTRKKFTDHLHDKLEWRGIKTFRDDPDLQRGTSISPELLAAIEHSRFAVVVLSPNYASSTWCLQELANIVQCMGDRGSVRPVFYEVDPSDVRHQRGSFAAAFAEHQDKFGDDLSKVQEWRDALTNVADLAGWASKDYRYETELIKEIVEELWKEVHPTYASSESESLENLVGIDSKMMEIEFLLSTEANDVCFVGIWGMGGIGKTTLARQVHHRISHHFEVCIFLTEVRQVSATHGLVHVQEQLLCQIMKEKNVEVRDLYDGVAKTKRCLFNKKVLLVIDDVDQLDQLEHLAGEKDWFGSGSIIIVTTRDQHLLDLHGIEKQYKSKALNEQEALQLFSWKAFKKDKPEEGYRELSDNILDYSRGLPLAIKILGSFLYKRDQGDWESAVTKLKKAPIDQVLYKVLRISYEGLDRMNQQVFLDVACVLKGYEKERVFEILDSSFGFDTRIIISVLIEKSLITFFDNRVDMHGLIQEMGREIVRLESEQEPGKRSHLWLRDDIFHVLKQNTGTEAVRSITISLPKVEKLAWNPNVFSKMSKLKFLRMRNLVLCQGPEYLPNDVRVLEWTFYPSNCLPPSFEPLELIELTLHHSEIHHLWRGIKYLNKLTIIDLSFSSNLIKIPDFTGMQNLERLIFEGCSNLVHIHQSITSLRRLKILNFKNCRSIKSFPGEFEMDSLILIDLSGCSKVTILPQCVRRIQKLSKLFLSGIGKQVSCDSVRPHRLSLILACLKHFSSLKALHLNDCKLGQGEIPDDISCLSSLEDLDLGANNFVSLPASISRLSKLKCLNLADCKRLRKFPDLPLFSGTCHVTADNCKSLKKFAYPPEFSRVWKLSFSFINCCSVKDGRSEGDSEDGSPCYIIYSMLQRFLQEPPPFFEMFSIVIPGDDIPLWFKFQSEGNSVTTQQKPLKPDCFECTSSCLGYALCVLFGIEENPGELDEDHANTISCSWQPGLFVPASFTFNLNQVVTSDHLCVFLLPSKHYSNPGWNSTEFVFEAAAGLKVKKCGVHALYKPEVKELDLRMKGRKRSCSNRSWRENEEGTVFSSVIPGNDIPAWFETRGMGKWVRLEQSCMSCCKTWMGFAICVLFEHEEIEASDDDLLRDVRKRGLPLKIWCGKWMADDFVPISGYSCVVELSDHLCVFFIPVYHLLQLPKEVIFYFEGLPPLKVKEYGVRSLYMHDLPRNLANRGFQEELLLLINSSRSSSSGSSSGCVFWPRPDGKREGVQALALKLSGTKTALYNCKMFGFQDTLCNDKGNHFIKDSYVEGTVDFIFGSGKSLYLNTQLHILGDNGMSVITAHAREDKEDNGYSFVHCNITGTGNGSFLGRAWRAAPKVVFAYTSMGEVVKPEGWTDNNHPEYDKTVHFGEYKNTGPGSSMGKRVSFTKELSDEDAKLFLSLEFIEGSKWLLPPPTPKV